MRYIQDRPCSASAGTERTRNHFEDFSMKVLRATLLLAFGTTTLLTACGDDSGSVTFKKGIVDEAALSSGVTVRVSGQTGSVAVPFVEPVPDVADEDLQDELQGAVSLGVVSNVSGAATDLAAGTLVDGTPAAPGQWSWQLNDDRDEATLTFFNQTPSGLTLTVGNPYSATLSLSTNDYIERLSAFTMQVTVSGG
jgi:hypothetical protein